MIKMHPLLPPTLLLFLYIFPENFVEITQVVQGIPVDINYLHRFFRFFDISWL